MMSGEEELCSRLCVLRLWSDFQGYGFNLHGEKNKSGHFIGEVEDGSPARSAGLRFKDRLIEVNGVNIYNDSHKEVVQRIKESDGNVSMLVVDEDTEAEAIRRGIVISATTTNVERIEAAGSQAEFTRTETEVVVVAVETTNEEPERTEEEQRQYEEAVADSVAAAAMESVGAEEESAPSQPEVEVIAEPEPEPEPAAETVVVSTVVVEEREQVQENGSVEDTVVVETVVVQKVEDDEKVESVTTVVAVESTPEANGAPEERLTAAEFRARLHQKKKQDPRKSGTSFKDKTLMFEKM